MAEVIDAEGLVLGRLASHAAERVKDGDEIDIINAEQAVVSGTPEDVFERYRERREKGSKESGPRFPQAPDRIVKRTVRGMLPNGADGREAFKRLTVYRGNPDDREADDTGVKSVHDLEGRKHVSIEEISQNI